MDAREEFNFFSGGGWGMVGPGGVGGSKMNAFSFGVAVKAFGKKSVLPFRLGHL